MNIRFLKLEDAQRCNDFYNRIHQTNRSLDQWSWEFEKSLFAAKTIPYVMIEDNGRVIGTQALATTMPSQSLSEQESSTLPKLVPVWPVAI